MKIVKYKDISDDSILQTMTVISGVTFLIKEQCMEVLNAADNSKDKLKQWFDIIGIKYDELNVEGKNINYIVNNTELSLSDLSSGERLLLYLLACKISNKPLVVKSLFERLGNRLEQVVFENLSDYTNLIVIVYNAYPKKEFEQFFVKEI